MSIDLPGPISAYFKAKNEHDIDAMLAPFDEDASVKDEARSITAAQRSDRGWKTACASMASRLRSKT